MENGPNPPPHVCGNFVNHVVRYLVVNAGDFFYSSSPVYAFLYLQLSQREYKQF